MATQQQAPRPWFRLASLARPVQPTTPTPEPPPPQIRAPMTRPSGLRPQQTQEPTPAPAFPAVPAPAAGVSSVPTSPIRRTSLPPSPAAPATAATPPPPPPAAGVSSVPTSPIGRTSLPPSPAAPATAATPPAAGVSSVPTSPIKRTSVPFSPVRKPSPTPTTPEPTTTTSSVPSPPKPQVSAPSPSPKPASSPTKSSISSMPSSPAKPVPTTFSLPTFLARRAPTVTTATIPTTLIATTRVPSPTPSPRTLKPAVQTSPMTKPTAPPPSPLTLPPPQLKPRDELEPKIPEETEQKTVLVQKNIEKSKPWVNAVEPHKDFHETHKQSVVANHHHAKHEVHKDDGKKEKGHRKKFSSDSDREVPMKIITIAGENKGALMEVIKSPMKHTFDGNSDTLHKKGNPKSESDGTVWHSYSSSSGSGEEGKIKRKDKSHKGNAMLSPPRGAFMNSNVQCVNNSILFNSSCTHHDPGVHLALSRKPFGHGFHVTEKSNGHHS